MDLDLNGVGVMCLKGGNYLVNKSTSARVATQIKKHINEKNEKFFKNLVEVADKIFISSVKKGEIISSQEPTFENFRDFVSTTKKLNFVWLIGATYTN